MAKFLLNREFDRAEEIIRKYVDDFNYKLIIATFDVLKTMKNMKFNVNYDRYKIHHMDNYLKLKRKSVLKGFMGKVKVEDDIDNKTDKEKTEDSKKVNNTKKDTINKKENTTSEKDKKKVDSK